MQTDVPEVYKYFFLPCLQQQPIKLAGLNDPKTLVYDYGCFLYSYELKLELYRNLSNTGSPNFRG